MASIKRCKEKFDKGDVAHRAKGTCTMALRVPLPHKEQQNEIKIFWQPI